MEKLLLFFGFTPKWNASAWKSFWTTKLSALQVALGAATAVAAQLPPHAVPEKLWVYLGIATVVVAVLTPPAAAAQQPNIVVKEP